MKKLKISIGYGYILLSGMYIFINVATREKGVIFFDDQSILWRYTWSTPGQESRELLAAVRRGQKELDVEMEEVQGIVLCIGPGAFTSLRVAVSIVNVIWKLYPKLDLRQISVGNVFYALYPARRYIFQPYPSDYFLFGQDGLFVERVNQIDVVAGDAGETLDEKDPMYHMPPMSLYTQENMRSILDHSENIPGEVIVPFYAKSANITTPKKAIL